VTETGTSYLGVWDTQFKSGMTAISQTLWSSIGYALPAAKGAGSKQRVILFEGDGSFQLTAQAVSDMVRHKLDLIVFLLNNDGYTIERWVHGMEAGYNDINGWNYTDIPRAMGGDGSSVKAFKVETKTEIEALWMDPEFWNGKGLRVSLSTCDTLRDLESDCVL
jgi:pyruvate decarboxylase